MNGYFFCNGCGEEFFFLRLSLTRNLGEDGEENYCFCCTERAADRDEVVSPLFNEFDAKTASVVD